MSDQTREKRKEKIRDLNRFLYFLIGVGVFFLDRYVKAVVSRHYLPGEGFAVIKNVFHITLVHNTGIAFGLLRDKISLSFLFFILGVIIFSSVFLRKNRYSHKGRTAIFLLIAGAVSNLFDRLRFGYVIDYLDFRIWPVFNLADTAITIGVGLFLWELFNKKSNIKNQISKNL